MTAPTFKETLREQFTDLGGIRPHRQTVAYDPLPDRWINHDTKQYVTDRLRDYIISVVLQKLIDFDLLELDDNPLHAMARTCDSLACGVDDGTVWFLSPLARDMWWTHVRQSERDFSRLPYRMLPTEEPILICAKRGWFEFGNLSEPEFRMVAADETGLADTLGRTVDDNGPLSMFQPILRVSADPMVIFHPEHLTRYRVPALVSDA